MVWLLWLLLILSEVVLGHQGVIFYVKLASIWILGYLKQRLGGWESGFHRHIFAYEFDFVVEANDAALVEGLDILFANVARLVIKQAVGVL